MGKSTAIRKTYERLHNKGKIKYVVFVNCRVVQTIDNSSVNDAGVFSFGGGGSGAGNEASATAPFVFGETPTTPASG